MKYLITLFSFLLLMASCTTSEDSTPGTDVDGTTFPDVNALSGSYANMIAVADHLYVIGETDIITYKQQEDKSVTEVDRQTLGLNLESLFYRKGVLFVGSSERMYICTLGTDYLPNLKSTTQYTDMPDVRPCDPIVANDEHAFVSLSSSAPADEDDCGISEVNQLRVFDISNLTAPAEVARLEMEGPKGMALDGDLLFVCEKENGLKVMDVSDATAPQQIIHFEGFETQDAVSTGTSVFIVGPSDLYEFDYTDRDNIHQIWSVKL